MLYLILNCATQRNVKLGKWLEYVDSSDLRLVTGNMQASRGSVKQDQCRWGSCLCLVSKLLAWNCTGSYIDRWMEEGFENVLKTSFRKCIHSPTHGESQTRVYSRWGRRIHDATENPGTMCRECAQVQSKRQKKHTASQTTHDHLPYLAPSA